MRRTSTLHRYRGELTQIKRVPADEKHLSDVNQTASLPPAPHEAGKCVMRRLLETRRVFIPDSDGMFLSSFFFFLGFPNIQ